MKKLIILFAICLTGTLVHAHTLLMEVLDNENNTVTVTAEFSTGQNAAGAQIRLESLASGKVLFKQRLPIESELTMDIPKEPYQIVLDGGPGHIIVKEGIPPLEGFLEELRANVSEKLSKPESNNQNWSLPTLVFFSLSPLLFILTIYFSARNTRRILGKIR